MSNVFAPTGEVTISDVFNHENETVYVVCAPNGAWCEAGSADLTIYLDEAHVFQDRDKAFEHAERMSARLRSAGAQECGSEFTVQEFIRTTVVSNFRNVTE